MKFRTLDLFSGIGGFSLGLERTGGFETVAFCEIEPFPRRVLARHWPGVPIYHDVRDLTAERLRADGIGVDVICGGFPCQDISLAGKGAGMDGDRSGLWSEYARLIGELRPRYVIVENVAALLGRGLDRVLGDLATLGFDAEWHCIPASAVGAPHRRDRLWIIAYAGSEQHEGTGDALGRQAAKGLPSTVVADADDQRQLQPQGSERDQRGRTGNGREDCPGPDRPMPMASATSRDAGSPAPILSRQAIDAVHGGIGHDWRTEPDVGRVAHGVPSRAHRLRALGNAVVPQIPELIGRAILEAAA